MKTDLRRFAPLGLVLSVLAVLAFLGIVIVKGLASAELFKLEDPKILDQYMWISVGVIILGLALTALLDPDKARNFFVGRQIQYGSNALLMLIAFVGILFFINTLVYQYSSTSTPWDWTQDKQNTLAPETLNILKSLPDQITVRAYYSNPDDTMQKLLTNFKQNSNGKFTYEVINPNSDPVRATSDGVTRDSTIVMVMGAHKEPVDYASEQELDAAIIRLTNPTQHSIYFLTGHGERDIQNAGDTSYVQTRNLLKNKNYTVDVLNLMNQHIIPDNAKVLIIAGPQKPLTDEEVTTIDAYLAKGGSLIVMEDPRQLTKFGDSPDPLATMLSTKWGITFDDDIVLDTNQSNGYLVAADSQTYGRHPITEKLLSYTIGYYTARSMKVSDTPPQDVSLTPLTKSLPTGVWGETNYASIQDKSAAFDAKTDLTAPLILAVAAENATTKGRVVVFGDSDFAADYFNQQQDLSAIFINSVDWSAQQENLINLTPKNNTERTFVPANNIVKIGSVLTALCIIPLLVIFAGILAWYSRRRRG